MISKGEHAPDFTLERQDGRPFTLSKEVEHGPLVLFFYPRDFTPICTAEACMFRDSHEELAAAGLRVFGVSPQSCEEHGRFRAAYGLTYSLLSDTKRTVISQYAEGLFGLRIPGFTRRVTYLIDRNMIVRDRVVADFHAAAHGRILAGARTMESEKDQSV